MAIGKSIRFIKSVIWNYNKPQAAKTKDILDFLSLVKPVETEVGLIRLGKESDGGYLVPDDFDGIESCFSPGVSVTADFEFDLTQRGIKCFLADASVEFPPIENPLFDFEKLFLGIETKDKYITLSDWVSKKVGDSNRDLILQMDIEGAEYSVLAETSEDTLKRFRMMVIEFHNLGRLRDDYGLEYIRSVFTKISKYFDIVHIHPNNSCQPIVFRGLEIPPMMEFTFLRKDRTLKKIPNKTFPHALDRKNSKRRKDVVLPRCWWS